MLVGVLLFSLNDVLGKWLVATYTVGQVMLLRSLAALLALAPFLWRSGWRAIRNAPHKPVQALRVALGTAEVFCFYWAVGHMPLADAMTYWMASPIFVVLLSALLLGERVGGRRLAAVALGFLGVAVALQPAFADGFALPQMVALAGATLYAAFLVCTRRLSGTPDTVLVALQMAAAGAAGLVLAPLSWVPPDLPDLLLLMTLGLVATVGHVCVTRSLKLASASVVVPWQYSFILWATLFGWLVWGDIPGPGIALGALLLAAAGLWLVRMDVRGR